MNEKIKFRAWDRELKRMFEVSQLDFSDWWVQCKIPTDAPKENGGAFYGERNSFKNDKNDRHILMQYTGLKDKNEKEIYEGDIVIPQYNGFSAFEVKFEKGKYNIADFKTDECEVIGNIFENVDLLNG
jgi:uncharacterized phage protein (TIGR01671 family)